MVPNLTEALRIYSEALQYIKSVGLETEVQWHRDLDFPKFTEADLLREAAWVILCSGFRESTVRRLFDYISLCFCDWVSAKEIVEASPACRLAARRVFRNSAKLDAIVDVARHIEADGFQVIKKSILGDPINILQQFSYIGPITALHLAKNLGCNVAKPDRHLVRLSAEMGFRNASELCYSIGHSIGEAARVVDVVLWRYLADTQWRSMKLGI